MKNNTLVLAHYYTSPETQAMADYVGDSLDLAQKAVKEQPKRIVFCGVRFMSETVKMMLPNTFNWIPVPAEAGSIFSEGSQIRTGPRSSVSLVFADSSVVLVDSLTYMTVEQFFRSGNVVTTRINLVIGSIVNTLNDGTPFDNDYKIVTPSLTETLNSNEIKKVVSGAMYKDSVRTGPREGGAADGEAGGYKKGPSAGQRAQEQQRQRESSVGQ